MDVGGGGIRDGRGWVGCPSDYEWLAECVVDELGLIHHANLRITRKIYLPGASIENYLLFFNATTAIAEDPRFENDYPVPFIA